MFTARRVLAAAAVAVLALSGCANDATNAAVVGGVAVKDADVQSVAAAAARVLGAKPEVITPLVAQALVSGMVAEKIGAAHQVDLSEAARAEVVKASPDLTALSADPELKGLVARVADVNLVRTKVASDIYLQECSAIPVTVNPRYGVWTKGPCSFTSDSGSLSQPAPTASGLNG